MTHIKWPNELGLPVPHEPKWPNELGRPAPHEPNWQNEAMRLSALLHSAMLGSAKTNVKLAEAKDVIKQILATAHGDDYAKWDQALDAAIAFIAELEKAE